MVMGPELGSPGSMGPDDRFGDRAFKEAADRMGIKDLDQLARHERERALAGQDQTERLILAKSTHPESIRWAFRQATERMESSTSDAPTLEDRYEAMGLYWTAIKRAEALKLGRPENAAVRNFLHLEEDDIRVHDIVPMPEALPEIPDSVELTDREKEIIERMQENYTRRMVSHLEAEERREPLIEELERAAAEFSARSKLQYQFSRYEATGGSVDEFAQGFGLPASWHINVYDLEQAFGAPATFISSPDKPLPDALKNRVESREFGTQVDLITRVYVVISLCEKPGEINKLRKTPGWRKLMSNFTRAQVLEYFGDFDTWDDSDDRGEKTIETEVRGKLTKKGNLFARAENAADRDQLRKDVQALFGGDESADRFGYEKITRLMGLAATGGAEIWIERNDDGTVKIDDKTKKPKQKIQMEGFPEGSDDLTKLFLTGVWQAKQTASGHPNGPLATRGEYDRLAVNFLRYAAYDTDYKYIEINPMDGTQTVTDKEVSKRSLWELWWGYPEEIIRENSGLPVGKRPEEKAHELGELELRKLPPDIWRQWMLRVFIAGRKGGVLEKITKIAWQPGELANTEFFEGMNRDLNVIVNDALATNGLYRGNKESEIKEVVGKRKKDFKKRFKQGIYESPENRSWLNRDGAIRAGESGRQTLEFYMAVAGYEK